MVEEYFEGKTLYKTMNEDEVVASGAAIMAVRLSGNDDNMKDVVLQDVTPLSLGIAIQINGVCDNMWIVVPNTSIPTSKKKMFQIPPNETLLFIPVYQGEGVKVKDNKLLGMFNIDVLPCPNWKSGLEVCFSLDINGILLVSAEEYSSLHPFLYSELKIAIDLLTNGSSENEGSNLAKAVHPSLCYRILSFFTWWVRSGLYSVLKSYPFREMEMASKDTEGTRITNLAIGGNKMFITRKDQQCVEVWQSSVRRS
nr:heat shock cognate 70 kDa protein-like [Tanacetum cinerariifolium]